VRIGKPVGIPELKVTRGPSGGRRTRGLAEVFDKTRDNGRCGVVLAECVGTLAAPFESMPRANELMAHFAVALEFNDGRIVAQGN